MNSLLKWPQYLIEAFLFWCVYSIGSLVPFRVGSVLAGKLADHIGPLLPINRIAHLNLKRVFPKHSDETNQELIKEMWENIGRTIGEYFKLSTIDPFSPNSPYEIQGIEYIDQLIQDQKPGLLFTAHLGQWEVGNYIAVKRGLRLAQVTRFLNNPLLRRGVNFTQRKVAQEIIPKGKEGIWRIVSLLRQGGHVSMMLDQKLNEGVAVPFFGHKAMTAPAIAKFALRFNCPIIPVQVERLEGVKCRITFHPPLPLPSAQTEEEQIYQVLLQINETLETWILKNPGQWFWVHKRWEKGFYNK